MTSEPSSSIPYMTVCVLPNVNIMALLRKTFGMYVRDGLCPWIMARMLSNNDASLEPAGSGHAGPAAVGP